MKFSSCQSASTLFVDNIEVINKDTKGQQRTCKALFKNFTEQLHSQTAEEKEKQYLTCRIIIAQTQKQGQLFVPHPS